MIQKSVPEIILDQLGGNRFLVMTGCHHLVGDKDKSSLRMTIPRNASRANRLEIILKRNDTYRMEFRRYREGHWHIRNGKCYEVKTINEDVQTFDGIYFNQLQALFTQVTGMYTSL